MRTPFNDAERWQCKKPLWGSDESTGDVCGAEVRYEIRNGQKHYIGSYCNACRELLYVPPRQPVRQRRIAQRVAA